MFFHIKMLDELVEEFLKEVDQNNSSSSIASSLRSTFKSRVRLSILFHFHLLLFNNLM